MHSSYPQPKKRNVAQQNVRKHTSIFDFPSFANRRREHFRNANSCGDSQPRGVREFAHREDSLFSTYTFFCAGIAYIKYGNIRLFCDWLLNGCVL